MRTRSIGSLTVSVVGLGCNNFGGRLDEARTQEVVDAALDAGVTFFDTADTYGGGLSETFLGRLLAGRRDRVVLATKFGWPKREDGLAGARPETMRAALEASLRRLKVDHVDLYQLHHPDPEVAIADTLGAMAEAVDAGLVREIGVSNFTAPQLEAAQSAAAHAGRRFASVQNEYSVLRREVEAEVLPTCERLGLAFLPYFPLLSGILSGKYRKDRPLPQGTRVTGSERWQPLLTDELLETVERLIAFAEARDRELIDLAFAYLLARPAVASVIAGATTAEQVRRNARAGAWVLDEEERAEVARIVEEGGY